MNKQNLYLAVIVFAVSVASQLVTSHYNVFEMDVSTWQAVASSAIIAVCAWFIGVAQPVVKMAMNR